MAIFIDSCVFVAYGNTDDQSHKRAEKMLPDVLSNKYGGAYTSDYVFDESVTVALNRTKNQGKASELGEFMLGAEFNVLKINDVLFQEAWEMFTRCNPERLSFTDCTNLAVMKAFGIEYIATFDKAFKKIKGITVVD